MPGLMAIEGVIVPPTTPFEDWRVDYLSLYRNVHRFANAGVSGIFVNAAMSEFFNLDFGTRRQLAKDLTNYVTTTAKLDMQCLVGVMGKTVDETVAMIHYANELDIAGIVIHFPKIGGLEKKAGSVLKANDEFLAAAEKDVYYYHNAGLSDYGGELLNPDLVQRMQGYTQVKGMKITAPFCVLTEYLKQPMRKDFVFYVGNAIDFFRLRLDDRNPRIKGGVFGEGNVILNTYVGAWNAYLKGDRESLAKHEQVARQFFQTGEDMPYKKSKTIQRVKAFQHFAGFIESPNMFNEHMDLDQVEMKHLRKEYEQMKEYIS